MAAVMTLQKWMRTFSRRRKRGSPFDFCRSSRVWFSKAPIHSVSFLEINFHGSFPVLKHGEHKLCSWAACGLQIYAVIATCVLSGTQRLRGCKNYKHFLYRRNAVGKPSLPWRCSQNYIPGTSALPACLPSVLLAIYMYFIICPKSIRVKRKAFVEYSCLCKCAIVLIFGTYTRLI